jgi:hypothetical protein
MAGVIEGPNQNENSSHYIAVFSGPLQIVAVRRPAAGRGGALFALDTGNDFLEASGMSSVGSLDFAGNAVWGRDWQRAREGGNEALARQYESIMQAQSEKGVETLQAAIRLQMVAAGHEMALDDDMRQGMLTAVQAGRSYQLAPAETAASGAGGGAPASALRDAGSGAVTLSAQEAAGYLLNDAWLRGDRRLSLADLWRAGESLSTGTSQV